MVSTLHTPISLTLIHIAIDLQTGLSRWFQLFILPQLIKTHDQDYLLRDTRVLGVDNTKAVWGRTTFKDSPTIAHCDWKLH